MEEKRDSIDALSLQLGDVFEHVRQEFASSIQLAYGGDGTLVIVSNNETDSNDFRVKVGESVSKVTNNDCGFLLSEGPDEYKDNIAAYVTESPSNAYDYTLGLCTELELSNEETNRIFNIIYNNTGGEGSDSKNKCAGFIYFLCSDIGIDEVTESTGVSKRKIQEYAMEASKTIS